MLQPTLTNDILIIEDDLMVAQLVRAQLANQNLASVHTTTGHAAGEWLRCYRPLLMLLDYNLPDMSGLELIQSLADASWGIPPFIVTTGSGDERIAVMMMKHGARDYVVKDENFLSNLMLAVTQVNKQIASEQQLTQAEQALRESQANYRQLFASISDAIVIYNTENRVLDCNPAALEMYGYDAKEFAQLANRTFVQPENIASLSRAARELMAGRAMVNETTQVKKSGERFPVEVSVQKINWHGQTAFLAVMRDITARQRAQEEIVLINRQLTMLNQLGQALNKLAAPAEILERIAHLVGQVFDNRNLYIALYDEATNYISFPVYNIAGERQDAIEGRPLGNGLTEAVIRTRAPVLIPNRVDEWLMAHGVALIGKPCECYLGVPMFIDDHVAGVVAVQDYTQPNVYGSSHVELLTTIAAQAAIALGNARLYETLQKELVERKRVEAQLRFLGTHDPLTGLFNRAFFESEIERLSSSRDFPISIVIADVDNMKMTNDTLGHAAGDELLRQAASVLQTAFRKSDVVARIGGDEFAIIWPRTDAEAGAQLFTRIQQGLVAFNTQAPRLPLQLSLGMATTTDENLVETLKLADTRMYADKRAHKPHDVND